MPSLPFSGCYLLDKYSDFASKNRPKSRLKIAKITNVLEEHLQLHRYQLSTTLLQKDCLG